MMRHCRTEGPTGGILMARPCQVSLQRGATLSPLSVTTTDCFCFMVPRAMKVCVWVMYALGSTQRDEPLSNSAKTGITSPVDRKAGWVREPLNALGQQSRVGEKEREAAHQGCSLCGRSWQSQTLGHSCGTTHAPSCLWSLPGGPRRGGWDNRQ